MLGQGAYLQRIEAVEATGSKPLTANRTVNQRVTVLAYF